MKRKFSRRYQAALLSYLRKPHDGRLRPARGMGAEASSAGLKMLDMVRLHEQTLVRQVLPGRTSSARTALIEQAGVFFGAAITPAADTNHGTRDGRSDGNHVVAQLSQRTVELAASNLALREEIGQRKSAEEALKKSERHYSKLLDQSDRLQERLRQLSRQILSAQEDERKRISRELHDVIAQTLNGINLRLATLKKEAALNVRGLDRNIARTQRLVEKSVSIVHQFARELRPAALDDLGLIPALHSFMKGFTARTGVRVHLTAFAGGEPLDAARRTALFRVAQEALTNVARHAQASRVEVSLRKEPKRLLMTIKDDGKSFDVAHMQEAAGRRRLGLLGMKERVEMVGGTFSVSSAPRHGTSVRVEVPFSSARAAAPKKARKMLKYT